MAARYRIAQEDCVSALERVESGSVAMVLTDPPFGVTSKKQSDWNNVGVDFPGLWRQLDRVVKPNGAVVFFGVQPFTTATIVSNLKSFKYTWIWRKSRVSNVLNSKKQPMNSHCELSVFVRKGLPTYHPQGIIELATPEVTERGGRVESINYNRIPTLRSVQTHTGYPRTVIEFGSVANPVHPTEKPVDLCEWLIRTYTDEGECVLDPYLGSGTVGVAARAARRTFIGCEINEHWCKVARHRLKDPAWFDTNRTEIRRQLSGKVTK